MKDEDEEDCVMREEGIGTAAGGGDGGSSENEGGCDADDGGSFSLPEALGRSGDFFFGDAFLDAVP